MGAVKKILTEEQKKKKAVKILKDISELMRGTFDPHSAPWCLWMVLSALRGPDSESKDAKSKTTAKIRSAIGIEDKLNVAGVTCAQEKPAWLPEKVETDERSYHFLFHYQTAVFSLKRLGLLNENPPLSIIREE